MTRKSQGLKAFQEATVDHVFRRLYSDRDASTHFLVADEVGLGKTLVAQGVIRKAVAHLKDIGTHRINIVYLCSNQAIAKQNLRKLRKALPEDASLEPSSADRMTLIALAMNEIGSGGQVNFFPLTPDTSFNMGNAMGKQQERRLLYHFLAKCFHGNHAFMREQYDGLPGKALMRMLKGQVRCSDKDWYATIVADTYARDALKRLGKPREILGDLHDRIVAVARDYPTHHSSVVDPDLDMKVRQLVKELRLRIAIASVRLLEPNLIIMDEFQRFTMLLNESSDNVVSQLVRQLTSFQDLNTGEKVRLLLLSATPYKHLTLETDSDDGDRDHLTVEPLDAGEAEEVDGSRRQEHHEDFAGTLRIIFRDRPEIVTEITTELARLRRALMELPGSFHQGVLARDSVQRKLVEGVARTERVDTTTERDSMVADVPVTVDIKTEDLKDALRLQQLAKLTGSRNTTEFWKSAPYLLNFMNGYTIVDEIEDALSKDAISSKAARALVRDLSREAVKAVDLKHYRPIAAKNGRLRAIQRFAFDGRDTFDQEKAGRPLAGHVWLPPALPYHHREPATRSSQTHTFPQAEQVSKALIFSSWQVVPDTVAALTSYEAERRSSLSNRSYRDYNKAPSIEDSATNILQYASPTIARMIDPLVMCYGEQKLQSLDEQRRNIVATLRDAFKPRRRTKDSTVGPAQQIWNSILQADGWVKEDNNRPDLLSERNRRVSLSDDKAFRLITDFCLGSPATCALRALLRVTSAHPRDLIPSARTIGSSIVRLMARPLNAAHILSEKGSGTSAAWVAALRYSVKHDLQSVLDEWFHMLANDASDDHGVNPQLIAEAVQQALSVTPSAITVRDLGSWSRLRTADEEKDKAKNFTMRGYFAMRLANAQGEKDDDGNRVGHVKDAFCSPFAPFILTTTSIGQEGLDFHPYCHRVYHWNIPTNPVDLEQREGRVHRFKGHALRLNLAEAQSHILADAIKQAERIDPWQTMFDAAEAELGRAEQDGTTADGRSPSWVLPGNHRVKRLALIHPFSREAAAYDKVRNDLTLYRLAFGQVRQDDLLNHLGRLTATGDIDCEIADKLQISLQPRRDAPL